jgi:hypothetical protein
MVSGRERGLRFDLGKIKRAGAWPNIVKQASGSTCAPSSSKTLNGLPVNPHPAEHLMPTMSLNRSRAPIADGKPQTFTLIA